MRDIDVPLDVDHKIQHRWMRLLCCYDLGSRTGWSEIAGTSDVGRHLLVQLEWPPFGDLFDQLESVQFHLTSDVGGRQIGGIRELSGELLLEETDLAAFDCAPLLRFFSWVALVKALPIVINLDLAYPGENTAVWAGGTSWTLHRKIPVDHVSKLPAPIVPPRDLLELLQNPPLEATDQELTATWTARNRLIRQQEQDTMTSIILAHRESPRGQETLRA